MRWVRVSHGVDHVVSHGFQLWDWSWGRSQCQSPPVITMIKCLEDLKYLIKCHFVFKVAVSQSASTCKCRDARAAKNKAQADLLPDISCCIVTEG